MESTKYNVCIPTHSSDVTFVVDRNAMEDSVDNDEKTYDLRLKPNLHVENCLDVLWEIILVFTKHDRRELGTDDMSGFSLFEKVTMWCRPKGTRNRVHAKIKCRVRQESNAEADTVHEKNRAWTTYVKKPEKNQMDYILISAPADLLLTPSIQKLHIRVCVTWRGDVTDSKEISNNDQADHITEDPKFAMRKLEAGLSSEKLCDIVFVTGEEEIRAHSQILGIMSEVFGKMFEHDMQEKQTRRVVIDDASPAMFRLMLRSLYTTKEPEWIGTSDEDLLELTYLAHKYALEPLQAQCACRMMAKLCVANMCKFLKAASALNLECVLDRISNLIRDNTEVLQSKQWMELQKEDPVTTTNILVKVVSSSLL